MAVRNICKYPDPVLSKRAEMVEELDDDLRTLIDDMVETMYAASGVGLAAPQVGVSKRLIVIDVGKADGGEPSLVVLINPEIVESEGKVSGDEGCLSFPEYSTNITRAERVVVKGYDPNGNEVKIEARDLLCRALQHEIDHLNGILIIDRISPIKRQFFKKRFQKQLARSG